MLTQEQLGLAHYCCFLVIEIFEELSLAKWLHKRYFSNRARSRIKPTSRDLKMTALRLLLILYVYCFLFD